MVENQKIVTIVKNISNKQHDIKNNYNDKMRHYIGVLSFVRLTVYLFAAYYIYAIK